MRSGPHSDSLMDLSAALHNVGLDPVMSGDQVAIIAVVTRG